MPIYVGEHMGNREQRDDKRNRRIAAALAMQLGALIAAYGPDKGA
jgi:hypothetical protein